MGLSSVDSMNSLPTLPPHLMHPVGNLWSILLKSPPRAYWFFQRGFEDPTQCRPALHSLPCLFFHKDISGFTRDIHAGDLLSGSLGYIAGGVPNTVSPQEPRATTTL